MDVEELGKLITGFFVFTFICIFLGGLFVTTSTTTTLVLLAVAFLSNGFAYCLVAMRKILMD